MTTAKLVLILCKLQDYYFALSGRKGTPKSMAIQDVLTEMVEYAAEPSVKRRESAEFYFANFLNIFANGDESK